MRARLEFQLPEEETEFRQAFTAGDMHAAIHEYDMLLREHLKHGAHPEWHGRTVEEIRTLLHACLQQWDILLD